VRLAQELRDAVERRARGACEYCALPQDVSVVRHQVDHIIGRQHQGSDDLDNLCLCCIRCNRKKGPNIASVDPESQRLVGLFHPRRHAWAEHLVLAPDGRLHGVTAEGRATVQLMDMNDAERVTLRSLLLRAGRLSANRRG
jgi:hypothetical protein